MADLGKDIKFSRIAFFKAASEFLSVYSEMDNMLRVYVKNPKATAKDIKERNERLRILVDFYNSSHEVVEFMENFYEATLLQDGRELDIFAELHRFAGKLMEFGLQQYSSACKQKNWHRAEIALNMWLKQSEIPTMLNYLQIIQPEQVDEKRVEFSYRAPKFENWMVEGNIIYRKGYDVYTKANGEIGIKSKEVPGIIRRLETFDVEGATLESFAGVLQIEWEGGEVTNWH